MATASEYKAEYKALAKRIDQRLRELEKAGATQFAYKTAQRSFGKMFPGPSSGKPRFEKVPKTNDIRTLRSMINELKSIEHMASSTKTGLRQITKKATSTLNRRYKGLDFEPGQLGKFFESEDYKKLIAAGYDSDTIVKGIAYMRTHRERIEKALRDSKEYHLHGNFQNDAVRAFVENRVNSNMVYFDSFMSGFGL